MILFNAPVPVDDHEMQAILMSFRMRESMALLAQGWKKHGYALRFGVGIAGGYATMGAIGYKDRLEYSAIGTVVNLAARLCGEARQWPRFSSRRGSFRRPNSIDVEPVGNSP